MWKNECVSIDLFIHVIFCLLNNFKKNKKTNKNVYWSYHENKDTILKIGDFLTKSKISPPKPFFDYFHVRTHPR